MSWFTSKAVTIAWLLAFLALIINTALSLHNLRWLASNEEQVRHTYKVLNELGSLLSGLKDAETGERGFIITGEPTYLQPYNSALTTIRQQQQHLRSLIARPDQTRRLDELDGKIDKRLAELQRIIELRTKESPAAAREAVLTGRGKEMMDDIRARVGHMEDEERQLQQQRTAASEVGYRAVVTTEMSSAGVTVAMTGIAYLIVWRQLRMRHQVELSLREAQEELEQRVRQRTMELTAANEALQRSNQSLEQFAAVASHDLQEPLRKIQAFGDRLHGRCGTALGEQGQDYLSRMQAAAARMRRLIDDLLTFSRVSTRLLPFEPVNLAEVAREVVSDLEGRLQQSGGKVEVGELPTVDADPLQMRQLLQNLVGNGLKFHRPDEPAVVSVSGRVLTADHEEPAWCEIAVRDNGIGFEEAFRERIFQMFQRLHGHGEYEGTGIGLAVCRKIVERHGGQISAHSSPGQGATFLVTLPMQQPGERSSHHANQG